MAALKSIGYSGDLTLEVFGYLERIGDDFMADALEFAAKTGRNLIKKQRNIC